MEAAVEAAVAPEVVVLVDDDNEEEQQQQPEGAGAEAGLQRGRSKKRRRRREEERRRSLAPEEQTLRLRVSELACVVGHHPYQCIVEAVMNHLYQDLSDLLDADASAVGVALVSREREVAELIKHAGPEGQQALRAAQRCARAKLQSVGDVTKAQATIAAALDTAAKGNRLPQGGLERIESALRDSLFTGFGRRHEDAALAELERRYHAPVHSRNEELWTWVFPEADAASGKIHVGPDCPPRLERKRRTWSWGRDEEDEEGDEEGEEEAEGAVVVVEVEDEDEDEADGGDGGGKKEEKVGKEGDEPQGPQDGMVAGAAAAGAEAGGDETQTQPPPPRRPDRWKRGPERHFFVTGSIDGMREEVAFGPDGQWRLASVIVEVKHRVREEALQRQQAPPFYEQLQLATYMLMLAGESGDYDVRGDLVEVVKTRGQRKRHRQQQPQQEQPEVAAAAAAAATGPTAAPTGEEGGPRAEEETNHNGHSPLPMAVTRITLDGRGGGGSGGGGLEHRRLYYQHVVPTLYQYVNFVYTLRCGDESVRRAFLASDDDEKFAFIQRHLPFVQRARFSGIRRGGSAGDDGGGGAKQELKQQEGEQQEQQPPESIAGPGDSVGGKKISSSDVAVAGGEAEKANAAAAMVVGPT